MYAEDPICFSQENAKNIIVELDQCRITNDILKEVRNENAEQSKMIVDLNESNRLCQENIGVSKKTIESQQNLIKESEKICDQRVSDAKPKFTSEVLKAFSIIVVGIVIGLLL